jgi:hypothetical protein
VTYIFLVRLAMPVEQEKTGEPLVGRCLQRPRARELQATPLQKSRALTEKVSYSDEPAAGW